MLDYLKTDLQFLLKEESDELPAARDPAEVKDQLMTVSWPTLPPSKSSKLQ